MTVELNVFNASQQHLDFDEDDDVHEINMIENLIQDSLSSNIFVDPIHACLNNFNLDLFDDEYISEVNSLIESAPFMCTTKWKARAETLPLSESKSVPSLVETPKLELKPLPDTLKYAFLESSNTLPVIISSFLDIEQESKLLEVLKEHKEALGWKILDIKGISPTVCMHHINIEDNSKTSREMQRRLNPNMKEVVRGKILKLLDASIIYPISDSKWVSPIQVVPKKSGVTVVQNDKDELVPTRVTTGWRVCIDYRKLNAVTRKDHFPLSFTDQMLENLSGHSHYCFLDDYSSYNQIHRAPEDQEKTMFLMEHFLIAACHLGIVLGHIISGKGIEVDKAKVYLIQHLPQPLSVREVRSFLGHACFDRRLIKDFSKIPRPLCNLLGKDVAFVFDDACKLRSRWTGPFMVRTIFPHGSVELEYVATKNVFKVSGKRTKPFLEPIPPEIETTDLADPIYVD
ncbi:uncharacterized protein LOC113306474 [Papaver somniferum]|uniref:uncharacterized protein LOC113306474 n=1 Tax=Papaver somniferum TaxID=3469 RepID=UPI000E706052|nr:uncharacterized protein LOC113306474 [Papaver somniferum]